MEHPAVLDAAVVGSPDEMRGEVQYHSYPFSPYSGREALNNGAISQSFRLSVCPKPLAKKRCILGL